MGEKRLVGVSVHELIGHVLLRGDLSTGFLLASRLTEGAEEHRSVQRARKAGIGPGETGRPGAVYTAEVPQSYRKEYDSFILEVSGRADGILVSGDSVTVEEIKTTSIDPMELDGDGDPMHWAQAKCYAAMAAFSDGLNEVTVRLTYRRLGGASERHLERSFAFEELSAFFLGLVDSYADWTAFLLEKADASTASLLELEFPFGGFRAGQRPMAASVFRAVRDGRRLFVQAPTGTGKTMAVLYPALRALGKGFTEKIFYLTAKTVTRTAAEAALAILREKGMKLSSVTLTAKEKICFRNGRHQDLPGGTPDPGGASRNGPFCTPEFCPFAVGYFDRINSAVRDALTREGHLDRIAVEEIARAHSVCPFELSLDVSLRCSLIICDYNYLFDPRASLKRYFQDRRGDYTFLIDEAHNLPDRARDMFSADITKREVLDLKRLLKGKSPGLARVASDLNALFIRMKKNLASGALSHTVSTLLPEALVMLLERWIEAFEADVSRGRVTDYGALEFTWRASAFLRVAERFDSRYIAFTGTENRDTSVRLFCLDPSTLIEEALEKGKSAVFFSATLRPMEYFTKILGTDPDPETVFIPSPFPPENLKVFLDPGVSTRFTDREGSYYRVATLIAGAVRARPGNYLAFFPSYRYMEAVAELFEPQAREAGIEVMIQSAGMSEGEREEFLSRFAPGNTGVLVGFAVMGGIFGEGIDLAGDRLSGAVIVGVGLPQVNREREAIRSYYEERTGDGFAFAYAFPGMNRVLQAAGRVIRSETDRGIVLLVDDRFASRFYASMLPEEWKPLTVVPGPDELRKHLSRFWDRPHG